MPTSRTNLLFVMTDHQRADSLGMIQDGQEATPHLNRLAAQSTTFTRAYNTCPLCVPARTALATGLPPHSNGVIYNDWRGHTSGDHVTMHELLHRAGYRVGHVGIDHIRVTPSLRDRVPFDLWYGRAEYNEYLKAKHLELPDLTDYRRTVRERDRAGQLHERAYSSTRVGVFPHSIEDFLDWQFTDEACRFLEEPGGAPFALFVYLWAPHPPLIVPEPYASMFDPAAIDLAPNVGRAAEPAPDALRYGIAWQLGEGVTEGEWRKVWAAHLGLVRMADDCLGRMLDAASRRPNTAVAFTVDHGEHLGAHGMYQKMECYEEAIHIPLVIRSPDASPRRYDGLVSHLDLMPTVMDLFALGDSIGLPGKSLRGVIERGDRIERDAVFSGYNGNPEYGELRRAVVGERLKYIWHPAGGEELYDLQTDPYELTNLADDPDHAAEKARLVALGRDWGLATGDDVWRRTGA